MTLHQIIHIKKTYTGLKIQKNVTKMYNNKDWGATFTIDILHSFELKTLIEYCEEEKIWVFIGRDNIYFQ